MASAEISAWSSMSAPRLGCYARAGPLPKLRVCRVLSVERGSPKTRFAWVVLAPWGFTDLEGLACLGRRQSLHIPPAPQCLNEPHGGCHLIHAEGDQRLFVGQKGGLGRDH